MNRVSLVDGITLDPKLAALVAGLWRAGQVVEDGAAVRPRIDADGRVHGPTDPWEVPETNLEKWVMVGQVVCRHLLEPNDPAVPARIPARADGGFDPGGHLLAPIEREAAHDQST